MYEVQITYPIITQSYPKTIFTNIKSFVFYEYMYNGDMKQRKRFSTIFLILGIAFLAIGIAADQTVFSWIAIAFLLISLISGGRWLRPRT